MNMTKEKLLKVKEMINTVQKNTTQQNTIKAYQAIMDLELQKGETVFLSSMLERLMFDNSSAAVIHTVEKNDYNFRNRIFYMCWALMLDKRKMSSMESSLLLSDPSLCPYDDILFFTINPEPGKTASEGYIREQEILKKLEELGFAKEEIKKEKNLFEINMIEHLSLTRKPITEQK